MSDRKALSKRARFEVFKRDLFVCQYCGQKPPAVVLEVDHIVPVSGGGSNEPHNLITSCFDCNRGKADGSLTATPLDVAARRALLQERLDQAREYESLLAQRRMLENSAIEEIVGHYEEIYEGWSLTDRARASIRQFLKKLPESEVAEAMELACSGIITRDAAFRYFCGICWRKIKGD